MLNIYDFFVLGLIGGVSPGPITALMLGETLRNGKKKGLMVPLAVIFSNVIIAPLAIFILSFGKGIDGVLGLINYAGAGVLLLMGLSEFKNAAELKLNTASNPFMKGLLIDLINPHPYVFWFTVLGPSIVLVSHGRSLIMWAVFVGTLVGLKALFVLLADKVRKFLQGKRLILVNRILAILLIAFGVKLLMA